MDLSNKTIEGTFTAENRAKSALTFSGKIKENGFSGIARTGKDGLNIQPESRRGGKVVHLEAQVNGGFYGKNAAELGGIIHSNIQNKDKISGVFGAKKQVIINKYSVLFTSIKNMENQVFYFKPKIIFSVCAIMTSSVWAEDVRELSHE